MKKILMILLISVFSYCYSEDFSFIEVGEAVYSTIKVNINGDEIDDLIVSTMPKNELNRMKTDNYWSGHVDYVYFVIMKDNSNFNVFKLDITRSHSLSIDTYNQLKSYTMHSQLGKLNDFFYIKDLNNNGRDEIYFIEYGWDEEFFTGYEFDGSSYNKVIDIDINGYCKKNFVLDDTIGLNIIRGEQYKELYQTVSDDVYRSWRTYFDFNEESGIFEEIKTVEIESPRSDFF